MPTAPYAKLRANVAGAGNLSGALTGAAGATCQLTQDPAGGGSSFKYEITDYPEGFPCPAEWTADAVSGVYYYLGLTPPSFTLPALPLWGKLVFRLTVNNGDPGTSGLDKTQFVDRSTVVSTPDPSGNGFEDIAYGETNQWDLKRKWMGPLKRNIRRMAAVSVALGLGPYASATARRAQSGLTSADIGRESVQTDTNPPTFWKVSAVSGGTATWRQITTTADAVGPSGTDYGALAVSNGLGVVGYFRGEYGLSGSSGSGYAAWANIAGAMSSITPHGTATDGIGAATAGLGGRAGLKLNAATQMGLYTAPVLDAPGTTNWHRYWIARQASGSSGSVRRAMSETGDAYQLSLNTVTVMYAYGATTLQQNITEDVWQRGRVSYTGSGTSEWKLGSQTAVTGSGGGSINTVPATARTFGSLLLNWEWLLYMELTGPKANFLTFAGLADTAQQTDWGTIQV